MKRLAVIVAAPALLLAAGVACRKTSAPSRPFEQRVLDHLATLPLPKGTAVRVLSNPLRVHVTAADGSQSDVYLENARRACDTAPADCDVAIDRQLQTLLGAGETRGEDPATLRATVQSEEWLEDAQHSLDVRDATHSHAVVSKPLVGDLVEVFVFDAANSVSYVTNADLKSLAMDEPAMEARAIANLRNAIPKIEGRPLGDGSGVGEVANGDSYDAARLLRVEAWTPLARSVHGDLIACAPTRNRVLYTGSANDADLRHLRELAAKDFSTVDHPISTTLLRWTPGGWVSAEGAPAAGDGHDQRR